MYKEAKNSLKAAGGTAKWRELCDELYDSPGTFALSPLLRDDNNDEQLTPLGKSHTPEAEVAEAEAEVAEAEVAEAEVAEAEVAAATEAAATEADAATAAANKAKAACDPPPNTKVKLAEAETEEAAYGGGRDAAGGDGGGTGIMGSPLPLLAPSHPSAEDSLTSLQRDERERWGRFADSFADAFGSGGMPPPATLSDGSGGMPRPALSTGSGLVDLWTGSGPAQPLTLPSSSLPSSSPLPSSLHLPYDGSGKGPSSRRQSSSGGSSGGSPPTFSRSWWSKKFELTGETGKSSLIGSGVTRSEGGPVAALSCLACVAATDTCVAATTQL